MEDSWRFRPIQGNICPTCSNPHFPFCPQPPPPPLPPSFDSSFHRPPPYFDPNHGFPRPIDVYQPSLHFDYRSSDGSGDRSVKRMRVGEMGSASFAQIPPPPPVGSGGTRHSVEDARRLSLIRDHGAPAPPTRGNPPLNGYYSQDGSLGDWQSQPTSNNLYDPVVDAQNNVVRNNVYDEKREFGYDHQKMQSYMDGKPRHHPNYRQNDFSHNAPYGFPQNSMNMYNGNGSYQLQAKGMNLANEFPHNSPLSGSSVPVYENKQSLHMQGQQNGVRPSFESSVGHHNSSMVERFDAPKIIEQGAYLPISTGNNMVPIRQIQGLSQASGVYPPLPPLPPPGAMPVYPPLPPLPPPPLPMEPPGPPPLHLRATSSPPTNPPASSDVAPLLRPSPDKPKVVDTSSLFKRPGRDTRPDHIVVILRGLPGSGKSYLAKMLRDLEVENGANAPRIHSMDDYFMTEVEKVEESEVSKSSGSIKGKKRVTKKVMEYCYEPEMEEAYRSSMLKAFKKTLEDGIFTFIIVDDRNLRVADFAQFWASAKRSGYEVYLLEAMYKDPVGCAARNIHGFSSDDIQKMAELWEEAPSLYLRLDSQSLFHGDDLKEHGIQEVDMDMDDISSDDGQSGLKNRNSPKTMEPPQENQEPDDSVKEEERWNVDDPEVKELGKSKWSNDADEEDIERSKHSKKAPNVLSGLIQAYTRGDKSVHWGDQIGNSGFSIGASRRANVVSLVIGPGAGYNLKSNPLPEEENEGASDTCWQLKKRSVFEEQLRAERASERESFKTVVDRRRQRIVGLEMDDDLQ
ncbi:Ylp motif-containing protein [Thalictrum thalictroides]|uniref:Ylp motif-containing protein n=1 Tax=Thalictrum thalictroides TaxID=46969 RepID=A0A7J6X862_THATH|nr:Ylp motif-containing protein [Thalictrum thalictroides]